MPSRHHLRQVAFNSWGHNDARSHQQTVKALVQMAGCRLLDSKPLFEPILGYFYLHNREPM